MHYDDPEAIGAITGLDDATVRRLVADFYARVRADPLLGPVFEARLGDAGWPGHLERVHAFWGAVARLSEPSRLRAMAAHAELGVVPEHFERWLAHFREAAAAAAPAAGAARLIRAAEGMAASLRRMTP